MTAKFLDSLEFEGAEFSLVRVSGKGLFDPAEHGLHPVVSTGRGFVCDYKVHEERLVLLNLDVNLEEKPSSLLGVDPVAGNEFNTRYERLYHPIDYTGGLLIGRDFLGNPSFDWGDYPAWKYREVHELIFEKGELRHRSNRSAEVRRTREARWPDPNPNDPALATMSALTPDTPDTFPPASTDEVVVFTVSCGWCGGHGEAVLDERERPRRFDGLPVYVDHKSSERIRASVDLSGTWRGSVTIKVAGRVKLEQRRRRNWSIRGRPRESFVTLVLLSLEDAVVRGNRVPEDS